MHRLSLALNLLAKLIVVLLLTVTVAITSTVVGVLLFLQRIRSSLCHVVSGFGLHGDWTLLSICRLCVLFLRSEINKN